MLKKIERRIDEISFADVLRVGTLFFKELICFFPAGKLLPVGHFVSVLNNVSFRK